MNERIKELAHEAGLPTYNPDGIPTKLEKFAELIVADCVNMIEAEAKNTDGDDVHGMRNAAGLISRAFIKLRG